MRRFLLIALLIIVGLIGSLAYANFVWLPRHAKPWLERTLTERTQLRVTIERLAFRLPLGWSATGVTVTDPTARLPVLQLHFVHARIAPWPLLAERRVHFVLLARLRAPFEASAQARGTYDWDQQQLSARVRVPDVPLESLPSNWLTLGAVQVAGGTLTGDLQIAREPEQPVRMTGDVRVRKLRAAVPQAPAQLEANVHVTGEATYDAVLQRWSNYSATLTVERGTLDIPRLNGRVSAVHGSARIAPQRVTDINAQGQWQDTHPIAVTGALQLGPEATADLTLTSTIHVTEALYPSLPAAVAVLQPHGELSLVLHWDGALAPASDDPRSWPMSAAADLRQGQLQVPGVDESITAIAGALRYQPNRVTLESLTCTHAQVPYTLTAEIQALATEPHLVLRVHRPDMSLHVDATLHEEHLSLARCAVAFHDSRVTLMGDLEELRAPVAHLYGEGTLVLADLARWPAFARMASDWALAGTMPFTLALDGPLRDLSATHGGLKFAATDLKIRDMPVGLARAELEWQAGRVALKTLQAAVAEGTLLFSGDATLAADDGPCHAQLTIDRMQLEPVLRAAFPAQAKPASGVIVSRMRLEGERCAAAALRGDGELHIAEGRLASVPLLDKILWGLLGGLAERLGYTELRRAELVSAHGRWSLREGTVRSDDLVLTAVYAGSLIPIRMQGWVGLDQRVDLLVEPQIPPDLLQNAPNIPPALRSLARVVVAVGDLKRLIGRQRVTGTLKQPVSRFEFSLDELLRQLPLQGLQQLLFPEPAAPQP